jgi:hypothetical protein
MALRVLEFDRMHAFEPVILAVNQAAVAYQQPQHKTLPKAIMKRAFYIMTAPPVDYLSKKTPEHRPGFNCVNSVGNGQGVTKIQSGILIRW